MIKIKLLLGFVACYTITIFIHLSYQVIYFESWKGINEVISKGSFLGESIWVVQNGIYLINLIGTIYICIALFEIIKKGYFNLKTARSFKIAGLFLCFVAVLDFVIAMLELSVSFHEEYQFAYLMVNALLFLIGFGVLIISQIIKKGALLKQENELTI